MKQYRYCTVQPKNMDRVYSYLSDRNIPVGSYVEIPFGSQNRIYKGVVTQAGLYTRENAPYPVEKTKKIIRVLSQREYEAGEHEPWVREIRELMELIQERDYDAVFQWAVSHHDCIDNPDIMRWVCRGYRLCFQQGNSAAALNLGTLFYNGTFLRRDYRRAAELYKIAADAGEPRAICNLGYCYYYGRHQRPDYKEAFRYFSLGAALTGDPNCLYKLGDLYREGRYVKKNPAVAGGLYFRALEQADNPSEESFCLADILLRTGEAYLYGLGVKPDAKLALEHLTRAVSGLYDRRKTDPYVSGPIARAKRDIRKAEALLDKETLVRGHSRERKSPLSRILFRKP